MRSCLHRRADVFLACLCVAMPLSIIVVCEYTEASRAMELLQSQRKERVASAVAGRLRARSRASAETPPEQGMCTDLRRCETGSTNREGKSNRKKGSKTFLGD
ncbi:hypothetical protein BESB_008630 [Besnoitia besnoiti]|uniref:Uncharacterized protein n=1 Tax=Besnoitia besnoiti TaxID=94643 RepID=A0A2A9MPC7_BESBE|nr:hypothetical protein BESB_008630 [Besnoitia besnoiti]PFH38521.1 hypothetical protein BESB_008630 [Besnoitia besnoiti]